MNFQIRKRTVLIGLVSLATLGCTVAAVTCYSAWLETSIRRTVHEQVLADNIQTAMQLTRLIEEMEIGNVRSGESWERLQTVVEDIELPNQGFVCVTDSRSGLLLCHPEIRNKPQLRDMPVGKSAINIEGEESDIVSAAANSKEEPTGGIALIKGEVQVVAIAHLDAHNANVLVHQREKGIATAIGRVMWPVRTIGYFVAMALTFAVTLVNLLIVRRYENRLADINEHLEETVRQRTRSLMKTRDAVIFGLAKLAESRDTDTGHHLERIQCYVTVLARRLCSSVAEIDAQYVEDLAFASSLHDIGKVGIPDRVLLKPGRFDSDERTIMEQHSVIGGECLDAIQEKLGDDDFLSLAKEIAYFHHEKWDGSGYPSRKSGEAIPISARIVALADVYDALTSKRPYKEPMSHEKARQIIFEGRGSHFDPQVVDAFLETEREFLEISSVVSQEKAVMSSIAQLVSELEAAKASSPTGSTESVVTI